MADYWKRRLEELNQTTKKTSSDDYWGEKAKESEESKKTTDIAPVKSTAKTDDRKWFEKGAFEDGYQFGDIVKTIGGTLKNAEKSVMSGILGIGEKAVDAGAYAVGAVGGLFSDKFKEKTADFIAKDLYDERAVAEKIVNGRNPITMLTREEDSVLGDKSDSVIESGGQLLGTAALQAVGVPWYLTTGATSFGSETENALGQGADYGAAGLSAAITAGAEILTEKISGGIKFGGSTLDDALTKKLALGISNKALRTMAKLGMDIAGEGSEEVISQFFSNLGTSLYREESLSDILFSEEALDEYLESFIGGAALGGAGGGFNAVNSAIRGVDATSGMTENEEKVFKKVYEDRVAEAGGEKLTTREKNKIYEEVERDMERGYISTDVIEEVLGGESYKAYKDTVDNENALRSEFDALGDTKESDLTVKQRERYNELKEKIAEMESGDIRNQFKADLDGEMQRLTQGSRLEESYAEKSRRGEKFDADLTVYDEKQKAVVQKAIDSGILNNSNRTHEFVDMVAKISADKGVLFDFTNNEKLKDTGFAVDGAAVNGFVTKDGVTVNIDSQKSLNSVVGHEITHVLEGTELYTELQNVVKAYAETKGEYQGRYDSLSALYKDIEGADIDAELTADLVGDYLFTDEDFVKNLSVQNRNVFQKIYDEIKYLYKVATAGSKEAREIERVKRAFDKAYKSGGKVSSDTKYSLADIKQDMDALPAEDRKEVSEARMRANYSNSLAAMTDSRLNRAYADYSYPNPTSTKGYFAYIDPVDFLSLTTSNVDEFLRNNTNKLNEGVSEDWGTENNIQESGILYLKVDENGNVIGHEGRHRMAALHREGVEKVAVIVETPKVDGAKPIKIKKIYGQDFGSSKSYGQVYLHHLLPISKQYERINRYTYGEVAEHNSFANPNIRYSLSDSDGKKLTKEQGEYFKDSKVRDDNGNLKVMYHGSQDAGFHEFDASMSDDDTSFFFVDRNDVAASYSGTSETYEAQSIRTAQDMNRFMESIDAEGYEVVEKDGKFVLLYEGERVADSRTAKGIYDEFCWYEGVGQGDANYKVYLNLKNPLEVDAKGRPWNKIDAEFSQEVYDRYQSLTAEERDALVDLAEWEDFRMFNSEIQEAQGDALASAYEKMGEDCNIYDLFSVAADNFSEEAMRENARGYLKTRDYAQRAKEQGYDGVIFKNIVDNGGYSNGDEGASTVAIAFDSNQIKSVANEKPTADKDIRYSLSEDSEGRQLSNAVKTRFGNSKVVDENGNLKTVYHGTASGEFSIFDKSKGSVEGDFGSGFYFTDNEADVSEHYEGGGPDFDNKVARRAEQIEAEEEIDYDEAKERARKELFKGAHKFEVYLNIENPAVVGETVLFDNESYMEQYNEEDYDDYDDYIGDVEQLLADDVENIIYEVERSTGAYSVDGLADVLYNAYYDGGIGIEELKSKIYDLYLEDENGNLIGNEVARQVIESLGYDGIIDPTVSGKWNMDIEEGTTHYIVFKPNQIKAVTNQNPTDNPDIHRSLSRVGETAKKHGRYHIKGEDVRYNDLAPVQDRVQDATSSKTEQVAPVRSDAESGRLAWFNRYGERVQDVPVVDDAAPSEPSLPQLREELAQIEQRAKEVYATGDVDALTDIGERHTEIVAKIAQMEADESARVDSIDDADAPPEADAPYQDDGVTPADPFAERDIKEVGDRKVNAYMYENPEVKPFFQEEANILLGELRNTTKGERYYTATPDGNANSQYGAESYGMWTGTSRQTTDDIAYLLDTLKYSYADIEKGLNAIIEDNGKENNAISKRIEFLLNDRLMKGHRDIDGFEIPPNQDYINLLGEKQITEYTDEARRSFFESVGATDIAPVAEKYEAIKPKKEPSMKRVENIAPVKESGEQTKKNDAPVSAEVVKKRTNEIYNKIKGLSSGKYHKIDDYGFHLARSQSKEHATITVKTPDGKKLQKIVDGGHFWKNERLWREASKMVAENEYPNAENVVDDGGKIAKVMVGEPEVAQKKINGWQKFRTNFLDKQSVFEDLALKTKNRELMGKANFMLSSGARAQHMIGKGAQGVKSLNDIRAEVEQTGQTERFYDYMYHRHNVDRMSMEEKARPVVEGLHTKFGHLRKDQLYAIAAKEITDKTTEKTAQSIREAREYLKAIGAKNKPVFGEDVTAEKSQEMVDFYERTRPQFKRYADDVYTYMNHLRGLMVENGVISQGTADLWQEMYPHYVPIRRLGKSGLSVNVPLDTNKTGINAPIKRAEGGNSDIMDMFDTMAMRTEQTYRAIAKNSFGVELKNTLGTTVEKSAASVDEVIDSIDAHEELLQEGKNGANPTFTVFENGERVTFDITDAMYDALKPTSDGLKYVNPVANTISKIHKGVLTEYNPVFSLTNAVKDAQDILMNSRHAAKTYANMPNALWQMAKGGKWYTEYMESGGEQNTYFDNQKNVFKKDDAKLKKALGLPLRGISWLNNKVEMMPRLAEYIASRKNGESVEVAMLDAARVTTNFSAGGDVAKFADRNGATFLNASIQGFNQQVRNVREAKANGLKGWMQLAAKTAIAGIPALILNDLLWDDDEEYAELSDYVKDSYYIVAKTGDGKFVRIPKGRTVAVIQDAMEQVKNALTGDDEVDLRNFLDIAFTNLAPNNPLDNNIIAPVVQAVSNRAWYGEDIVPTRLQDMPSAEQYDESTDAISKWLGEKTPFSPMKINYVLNQYGGGIADMTLPYLTPEAEGGGNKLIAPLTDKFTTDSVMKNQNVSDFYDTVDELTKNANSAKATDEDKLMSKYMNSVNTDLSALYQQKREIQNSGLSDAEKYAAVRDVQRQIDAMTKDALNTYGNVKIDGVYATVGDRHYHVNKEGAWEKVTDKQLEKQNEVTSGLGISPSDYWSNKEEYDFRYEYPEKYDFFRANGITYDDYANADEDGKRAYTWAAENPEKYVVSKAVTDDLFAYRRYTGELYDIKADKDEDGESISGSAKEKKTEYINNLDLDYGQKIILYRSLYDSKADQEAYNQDIVDYLNSREDISYEEMATILKELGFEVDSQGNISW